MNLEFNVDIFLKILFAVFLLLLGVWLLFSAFKVLLYALPIALGIFFAYKLVCWATDHNKLLPKEQDNCHKGS